MNSYDARQHKRDYYLSIAHAVAKRSTCLRRRFGAVVVKDDRMVASGYNGAPRYVTHCTDIGSCWRQNENIPSGERYERCRSVHAEQNAIITATYSEMDGAILYIAGWDLESDAPAIAMPCIMCRRAIMNAGIDEVIIDSPTGVLTSHVSSWSTVLFDEDAFLKSWRKVRLVEAIQSRSF